MHSEITYLWTNDFSLPQFLTARDSVQFSRSVMSNSSWPRKPQHARPPCPSPTPRLHPNPCPLSQWCHPTISSSVVPFSSCLQSFPASGSFPTSQLFASGGQSIGISASTSVLPMNTQDSSPLGWTSWISLQSKGLSRVFFNTTVQHINSSVLSFLYSPTLTSIHGKTIALTRRTFVGKVMSLLSCMPSRLVITFLPRSKHRVGGKIRVFYFKKSDGPGFKWCGIIWSLKGLGKVSLPLSSQLALF